MTFSSILLTGHEYVYVIISVFASRQKYLAVKGNKGKYLDWREISWNRM